MMILRNYLLNIILVLNNIIFPIILFPYASRILTPLYFGKYNFAISITNYFITFACLGVPVYGIRELSKKKLLGERKLKKSFSEIVYISFISSVVSLFLYLFIIKKFHYFGENKYLFYITGLNIVFSFLTLDYYFIVFEKHKRRTIRMILVRGISLIFLFNIIKSPDDYLKFALLIIVPEILAKLMDFFLLKKLLNYDLKTLNLKKHIKPLIIIFIYIFSTTIYLNLDSTMLGMMRSQIEVGYYNVAIRMTKIIIPLITSLGIVMAPRMIIKIQKNQQQALIKDMELYLNFIFFFALPAIGLLYLESENIIKIFSGIEYVEAIFPMKLMLPIILFISISNFCASQILIPMGYEKKVLKVAIIGGVSNLILNYVLIPVYGISGAALGTLISEGIVCFLRVLELKKVILKYKILNREKYKYFCASIFSIGITIILKKLKMENLILKLVISGVIYLIIYFGFLLLLKEYFVNKAFEYLKKKVSKFEG